MGWYRVSCKVGGSIIVRAESREDAVRQIWNALEELSRGAVEALRIGSYAVSEEPAIEVQGASCGGELRALVYTPPPRRFH